MPRSEASKGISEPINQCNLPVPVACSDSEARLCSALSLTSAYLKAPFLLSLQVQKLLYGQQSHTWFEAMSALIISSAAAM